MLINCGSSLLSHKQKKILNITNLQDNTNKYNNTTIQLNMNINNNINNNININNINNNDNDFDDSITTSYINNLNYVIARKKNIKKYNLQINQTLKKMITESLIYFPELVVDIILLYTMYNHDDEIKNYKMLEHSNSLFDQFINYNNNLHNIYKLMKESNDRRIMHYIAANNYEDDISIQIYSKLLTYINNNQNDFYLVGTNYIKLINYQIYLSNERNLNKLTTEFEYITLFIDTPTYMNIINSDSFFDNKLSLYQTRDLGIFNELYEYEIGEEYYFSVHVPSSTSKLIFIVMNNEREIKNIKFRYEADEFIVKMNGDIIKKPIDYPTKIIDIFSEKYIVAFSNLYSNQKIITFSLNTALCRLYSIIKMYEEISKNIAESYLEKKITVLNNSIIFCKHGNYIYMRTVFMLNNKRGFIEWTPMFIKGDNDYNHQFIIKHDKVTYFPPNIIDLCDINKMMSILCNNEIDYLKNIDDMLIRLTYMKSINSNYTHFYKYFIEYAEHNKDLLRDYGIKLLMKKSINRNTNLYYTLLALYFNISMYDMYVHMPRRIKLLKTHTLFGYESSQNTYFLPSCDNDNNLICKY